MCTAAQKGDLVTAETKTETPKKKRTWLAFVPLIAFLGLSYLFYSLLTEEGRNTSFIPSALLDKPAPLLGIPELKGLETNGIQVPGMGADTFTGKVSLVNVFASWCIPCRQEHPYIVALGNDDRFQVVGLNQRDPNRAALEFLQELGNPYDVVGVDRAGRASIEWGVYGVPESFIVNKEGRILYKHVGPINQAQLEKTIIPIMEQALAQ